MKSGSETKVSQPYRTNQLAESSLHKSSKASLASMPSENVENEEVQDKNSTIYREADSPTAPLESASSPTRATRGSIRQVTEGTITSSPRSPGSPLSNGVVHYGPGRTAGSIAKSPEILQSDALLRSPGTPASDMSEGWSAVGKATVGGKSGKVIERLQSEIDQLRRGLRASEAKYDEARTLYDTVIAERDELRASKETLDTIRLTNEALLVRRDRKIEQLRGDLEKETEKRVIAETAQRSTAESASKRMEVMKAERHKAMDESTYFKNQYDVLERSMGQLRSEYQSKTKKLSAASTEITTRIEADQRILKKYETGAEQLRANYERSTQISKDVAASHEAYKSAREAELTDFRTQAEQNASRLEELQRQLDETCGQMRQVMRIKETFKGEFRE